MYRFLPKVDESGVDVQDKVVPVGDQRPVVPVRIYQPQPRRETSFKNVFQRPRKLPAMVFMHWGGFCLGDLRTEHARCVRLSRDIGMLVVSVAYRLAPENPFPAGLDDCYAVLKWLVAHKDELQVDPEKIAVGGTSAGGGLAAALALRTRDENGPKIALQYLGFPVLDDHCDTGSAQGFKNTPNWTSEANQLMWKYYIQDRNDPRMKYAAPSREKDLAGLPHTYLWTAEFDPLRDEALAYAQRLMHAGVPVELHAYPRTMHGFDSSPTSKGVVLRAQQDQVAALKKVFNNK